MADTANLILNSGRCSHGKCLFCGYGRLRGESPTVDGLKGCFDGFFDGLKDAEVKVFGSGSFLDERQVPAGARTHFISRCREKGVSRLTVESRPEYVNEGVLSEFRGISLTVAMGLESADDSLLQRLQKGYGRAEFEKAADMIHRAGYNVRTYLLVNPPFVDDPVKSLDESVEYALGRSDSVVLINLLPHAGAPLSRMWLDGSWNFLDRGQFIGATLKWKDNPKVELDLETFKFRPSIPEHLRESLSGVGEWYLTHPHFEVWQDYLIRWYTPPEGRVLLFLPCSNRKPYSESRTHIGIIQALASDRGRFHEVMISNAGVIPREFEDSYPFNSYDWDEKLETPEVKKRYVEVTAQRISAYLRAHSKGYRGVACFLKYGSESYQALELACRELGLPLKNLLTRETYERIKGSPRPLQEEDSLKDLAESSRWYLRNST